MMSATKLKGVSCALCPESAFAASLVGSGRMTRQYTHSMYSAKEYTIRIRRLNTEPYLR